MFLCLCMRVFVSYWYTRPINRLCKTNIFIKVMADSTEPFNHSINRIDILLFFLLFDLVLALVYPSLLVYTVNHMFLQQECKILDRFVPKIFWIVHESCIYSFISLNWLLADFDHIITKIRSYFDIFIEFKVKLVLLHRHWLYQRLSAYVGHQKTSTGVFFFLVYVCDPLYTQFVKKRNKKNKHIGKQKVWIWKHREVTVKSKFGFQIREKIRSLFQIHGEEHGDLGNFTPFVYNFLLDLKSFKIQILDENINISQASKFRVNYKKSEVPKCSPE